MELVFLPLGYDVDPALVLAGFNSAAIKDNPNKIISAVVYGRAEDNPNVIVIGTLAYNSEFDRNIFKFFTLEEKFFKEELAKLSV